MSKFYNSKDWRDRAAVLAGIFCLISVLIFPVLAQSNRQSQSVFEPSSGLDSPDRSGNIADNIEGKSEFKTFFSALAVAGLTDTLKQEGRSLTIFAPTNQAFQKNAAVYRQLLQPQNKDKLARVLKYHLVASLVTPEDVNKGVIKTLEGSNVKIGVTSDGVIINDTVKAVQPSIEASNGVIVRVDNLLLPPDL